MLRSVPLVRWQSMQYEPNSWAFDPDVKPDENKDHVHGRPERFIAGTTARQVGKTVTASMEIDMGMSEPIDDFGPPVVGVLAPTYDKAELSVNMYITKLTETFGPESYKVNQTKHILTILNPEAGTPGAKLYWLSCDDPYGVVGYTFSKLIIDESQAVPDEVWIKIRPTLDVRMASVRAFGTPDITSSQSWFRGMWLRGQDDGSKDYHSFTVSCFDNPWMNLETILDAREHLTTREFKMLYLGEWTDAEGVVFTNISNSIIANVPAYDSKKRYVMAVDFAVYEDYNVVMIAEEATRIAVFMDRWNQTSPIETYDKIVSIYEQFGKPRIVADESGMGVPMVAELRRRGLTILGTTITAVNKMDLIGRLGADIEHRRIMFPEWKPLISEMKAFVYKRTPSGKLTASAVSGYHDDCVMALVLLNSGLRKTSNSTDTPSNYLARTSTSIRSLFGR